jgi:exonuclease I
VDPADLKERANWLSARAADRRLSHRSVVDPESDASIDLEDCPDANTTDTIATDALTNSTDLNSTDASASLEQLQTQSALLTQQLQGVTSQIAILNGTQAVAGVGADRVQALEDEKTQLEAQLQATQAQIEVLQHQVDLKQTITEGVQVMQQQDQSAATQQKRAKGFDGMFARWFGSARE